MNPVSSRSTTISRGEVSLHVEVAGSGPLVLMVHGFPELSRSWRHQLGPIAEAGYTAAALDVRGYGRSTKPEGVEAYTMSELADDLVAVIEELGHASAVLVGHDWGAAIVQATSLIHPTAVAGVATLSLPTLGWMDVKPSAMIAHAAADGFFYQDYFMQAGIAEKEIDADTTAFTRRFFYGASGNIPDSLYMIVRPTPASSLLEGVADPGEAISSWLPDHELDIYARSLQLGGSTGPLNKYRAQDLDWQQLQPYRDEQIKQPGLFIAGELDPVRRAWSGIDLYAEPVSRFEDCRGAHIIPGIGHWTQQEAPDEVNRLLIAFVKSLDL